VGDNNYRFLEESGKRKLKAAIAAFSEGFLGTARYPEPRDIYRLPENIPAKPIQRVAQETASSVPPLL